MNRKVYAILISVPWSDAFETDEIPDAADAMDRFCKLLSRRFTNPEPKIWHFPRRCALKKDVCDAFKEVRGLASAHDLFIVLFIGHGIPSNHGTHAYEAWALNDKEFSDQDLADHLAKLDPAVEVVVISDACYGAGIARPGNKGLRRVWFPVRALLSEVFAEMRQKLYKWPFLARYRELKLKALTESWTRRALVRAASDPTALANLNQLVCISAAAWDEQVGLTHVTELIDITIDAADHDETHGSLADTFYKRRVTGAAFQLQAFPNDRMCKPLFSQQSATEPKEEGSSMTADAADTNELTNIVFINYGDKEASVDITFINEAVAFSEIKLKPTDPITHKREDHGSTSTLKIPADVVVGLSVSNETTLKIVPGSRISVITWKGKDPPVPPPPPRLSRYKEALNFDRDFRALLGAAGASTEQTADTKNGDPTRPPSSSSPPSYTDAKPDQP